MASEKRMRVAQIIAQTKGKLYDANFDPHVLEALDECKELCYDYNQMRPGDRAGSVVTKDIPSGVVAVGNPCRVLRQITEADTARYELWEGARR